MLGRKELKKKQKERGKEGGELRKKCKEENNKKPRYLVFQKSKKDKKGRKGEQERGKKGRRIRKKKVSAGMDSVHSTLLLLTMMLFVYLYANYIQFSPRTSL